MTLEIVNLKTKPVPYEAVQFTGKNSKEVAEWVREKGGFAKAGGNYVTVDLTEVEEAPSKRVNVLKWDYVLFNTKTKRFGAISSGEIPTFFTRVKA